MIDDLGGSVTFTLNTTENISSQFWSMHKKEQWTFEKLQQFYFSHPLVQEFRVQLAEKVDQSLFLKAMIHRSFSYEWEGGVELPNNERLEYLGDSVVNTAIAHYLFREEDKLNEGLSSKIRAALVNTATLAEWSQILGIPNILLVGQGEVGAFKKRLAAGSFEALMGAIFLSSGYHVAAEVICETMARWKRQHAIKHFDEFFLMNFDPKSYLQEILVAREGLYPEYRLLSFDEKTRIFEIAVFSGERFLGQASHHSKREAEKQAAKKILEEIYIDKKGSL